LAHCKGIGVKFKSYFNVTATITEVIKPNAVLEKNEFMGKCSKLKENNDFRLSINFTQITTGRHQFLNNEEKLTTYFLKIQSSR